MTKLCFEGSRRTHASKTEILHFEFDDYRAILTGARDLKLLCGMCNLCIKNLRYYITTSCQHFFSSLWPITIFNKILFWVPYFPVFRIFLFFSYLHRGDLQKILKFKRFVSHQLWKWNGLGNKSFPTNTIAFYISLVFRINHSFMYTCLDLWFPLLCVVV